MATAKFKSASPYATLSTSPRTAALAPSQPPGTPPQPPVRVALIGVGRIGALYLSNICQNPDMCLVRVVVSPRQSPAAVRQRLSIPEHVAVTCNPGDVYSDASIRAVVIATSTATHVQLILAALDAGKAVYCEKPISESLDLTSRCYQAAADVGLPLFCAFNRRFDPSYRNIQEQARAGKVGHIQSIKSVSRDSPVIPLDYIAPSGGIFDDFSVHDIDLLLWVTGDLPVQVFVSGNAQIPEFALHGDFDNMVILMNFTSGTIGTIDLNRFSSYGYDQRLEVFGDLGMLHCEHSRPNHVTKHSENMSSKTPIFYSFPSHYHTAFQNQLCYFVELVRGNVPLTVTEKQTRAVSKVVQACKESAELGLPVKIVWAEEEWPQY